MCKAVPLLLLFSSSSPVKFSAYHSRSQQMLSYFEHFNSQVWPDTAKLQKVRHCLQSIKKISWSFGDRVPPPCPQH